MYNNLFESATFEGFMMEEQDAEILYLTISTNISDVTERRRFLPS